MIEDVWLVNMSKLETESMNAFTLLRSSVNFNVINPLKGQWRSYLKEKNSFFYELEMMSYRQLEQRLRGKEEYTMLYN